MEIGGYGGMIYTPPTKREDTDKMSSQGPHPTPPAGPPPGPVPGDGPLPSGPGGGETGKPKGPP